MTNKLKLNNVVVCSDFHVPLQSKAMMDKLLDFHVIEEVNTLIIAGDFWNFDKLSAYEIKDKYTLKQELDSGKDLLKKLNENYVNIYMVQGNHDARMPRALGHSMTYSEWMNVFWPEIFVTNADHLILTSGGKDFRIAHAGSYSKIKGKVACELAHWYQTNVIVGHSHNMAMNTNPTSKYIAVDLGCMCDPLKVEYKTSKTTMFPSWDQAFVHILNGDIRIISKFTF